MYSTGSDNMALGYALGRDSDGNRNDGFFGGDGWWAIILFAMIFGWGNGGWGGGFGGGAGATTSIDASLQRGFDTQTIIGKLDGITNGLCDGFYATNTSILNGFAGVDRAVCSLGYQTAQLANDINANITQSRFDNQQCLKKISNKAGNFFDYNFAVGTCAA